MLKTNVVTKTYRVTMTNRRGDAVTSYITGESPEAVRLKALVPYGWEIAEVTEL